MDRCPNCGYDPERHAVDLRTAHQIEIDRLRILLAWEAGLLSEGQVARLLKADRLQVREWRHDNLEALKADMPTRWAEFQAERAREGGSA